MKMFKTSTLVFAMCFVCIISENLMVSYCDVNPRGALLRMSIAFLCILVNYYHESNLRVIYECGYYELRKLTENLVATLKEEDANFSNSTKENNNG